LVLQTKARDLAMVELRLAPPFGGLADGYRQTLEVFLGEAVIVSRPSVATKHGVTVDERSRVAEALKKLDALDLRRRIDESHAVVHLTGTP